MSLLKRASRCRAGGCTCSRGTSKLVRRPCPHIAASPALIVPTLAELLHINRQSAYLIGRDRLVCDIYIEHPSCSKQHAVIQCTPSFTKSARPCAYSPLDRQIKEKNEFGEVKGVIKCVGSLLSRHPRATKSPPQALRHRPRVH